METSFAAVLFRPEEVPDRALSHGFAVALAGWDVPGPYLVVAELAGAPGWSAAFYRSGAERAKARTARLTPEEELDHACDLFEDELPPGLCVRDAAAELGAEDARVYALVYSEDVLLDDAWRFAKEGFERHFVREGDDGLERGIETLDEADVTSLALDADEVANHEETLASIDHAARPHRGSTFLARELGAPVLASLVRALFEGGRRVTVRLVEPSPASIADETRRLNRTLGRVDGRGAFAPPAEVAGVATPPEYAAFVAAYDFADPRDPEDLYRELSLGRIEGTLRFLRAEDLAALSKSAGFASAAARGLFPIARLRGSALGGRGGGAIVALTADRDALELVRETGESDIAGPTFGELLRYLALGWKQRSEIEEDLIGALMLRARLRASRGPE